MSLRVLFVRGVTDLTPVKGLRALEFLCLHGLPNVTCLPSFASLARLRHAEVGVMRGLTDFSGLADAPALEELQLVGRLPFLEPSDITPFQGHRSLERFDRMALDVPNRQWMPVEDALPLPRAETLHPEEWFGECDRWRPGWA